MSDDPLRDPRFPNRPQHPDFWRLSSVVLRQDGTTEDTPFQEVVAPHIDFPSLQYMAQTRAEVVLDALDIHADPVLVMLLSSAWLTGVVAGIEFQKEGGHRAE